MRILITGNMGYVGPVLTRSSARAISTSRSSSASTPAFSATVSRARSRLPEALLDMQVFGDIREFPPELLDGVDAVVHLAAVSNDPMGNKFEAVTDDDQPAGQRPPGAAGGRARASRTSSSPRAAACTATPRAARARRRDPTNPLTAYARSKIGSEQAFAELDLGGMTVTCAALRHRLRHVRPAAARSRAQRLRRLRARVAARSPCSATARHGGR